VRNKQKLDRYVAAVAVAGFAVFIIAVVRLPGSGLLDHLRLFLLFAPFVLLGEFAPINLPHRDETLVLTITSTFAFAMLLECGAPAAILTLMVASAAADLVQRVPAFKVVFNAAQYALSLGIAGLVWTVLGGPGPLTAHLPAAFLAAVVFFVFNYGLVGIAVGLAQGGGLVAALRQDFLLAARSAGMLLGMAPVVVVVAEQSLILVFTLAFPITAVYLAAKAAASANQRRAEAEAATRAARDLAVEQGRVAVAEQAVVRELQEADRIKTDLLTTVSHELRSPLTTILGVLRTLATKDELLPPADRRDLVEIGARQGEKLQQLIEQLLRAAEWGGEEAAKAVADRGLVDVAELARAAAVDAQRRHAGRPIAITAPHPLPVLADPRAVTQILASLIDNGCRFSPEEQPVRISARPSGRLAVIAVEDAGHGVADRDRHRIFDRFATVAGEARGVGLGLYVARQLARAQGGEVLIAEHEPGSGGRFELRLPLADRAGDGSAAAS
jgi:signal transduction histidine kinase